MNTSPIQGKPPSSAELLHSVCCLNQGLMVTPQFREMVLVSVLCVCVCEPLSMSSNRDIHGTTGCFNNVIFYQMVKFKVGSNSHPYLFLESNWHSASKVFYKGVTVKYHLVVGHCSIDFEIHSIQLHLMTSNYK